MEKSKEAIEHFPDRTQWSIAVLEGQNLEYIGLIKEKFGVHSINNENTLFEIGSITKLFTSHLLAELILAESIKLDDKVFESSPITYRDLAQHTSGLKRSILDYKEELGVQKVNNFQFDATFLKNMELILKNSQRNEYAYSNLGYQLLGRMLAEREGKPYETLLKEYIFSKAGMSHTYLKRPANFKEKLAIGQDRNGYSITAVDSEYLYAAGGLLSSIADMMKYIQYHLEDDSIIQLIKQEIIDVKKTEGISLGWHFIKTKENSKQLYWWHNGGTLGYRSCLAVNIESQSSMIILTNISTIHPKNDEIDKFIFTSIN